ncbi:DUF1330 domain-containing protein [Anaerophaga thermohalophila]|jgi:uncharacterized protein (DUF1330 family)|uniref:DUF1330 domain-containing protein n=1 Tax=Anaerophaga thermohalophila TaxID=177400 RepID=UPI0002D93693|nr:DUF1330 domain-containing protein [Anaerophaga thermohalophila]
MSYYFVANIDIRDNDEYRKYINKAGEVFRGYNGKYLAVDSSPILLEGEYSYSRTVIISFETREDFNKWYYSSDYQEILKHRLKAARCDTVLVRGMDE